MPDIEALLARRDVRRLCRLLTNGDAALRRRAAQALASLAEPASVPSLAAALNDQDAFVRAFAIDALAAIADAPALHTLISAAFSTDRQRSEQAAQALARTRLPLAVAALELRDILTRSDWETLARTSGELARQVLRLVLHTQQYNAWPSAKRKAILEQAVRLGVQPGEAHSRELATKGIFLSGVHTIGDLLQGINSPKPAVRIAAAERLAASKIRWAKGPLLRRLKHEMSDPANRAVSAALARALVDLGSTRGLALFQARLNHPESREIVHAADLLAQTGTPQAAEMLFRHALSLSPQGPPRGLPAVLAALEHMGPPAVDALLPHAADQRARLLLIEVIARSRHPLAVYYLGQLAAEPDPDIQRTALDALAGLGSTEAADVLYELSGKVERGWLLRALNSIPQANALTYLRALAPQATTLEIHFDPGEDDQYRRFSAQIVQEHYFGEGVGFGWRAISARAGLEPSDSYYLSIFLGIDLAAGETRLKLSRPPARYGEQGDAYLAALTLSPGTHHRFRLSIDRFFNRLLISALEAPG